MSRKRSKCHSICGVNCKDSYRNLIGSSRSDESIETTDLFLMNGILSGFQVTLLKDSG